MVIRKPKKDSDQTNQAKPSVELMEHLVKKSLDINPDLRGERDTNEVLDSLKQEVLKPKKPQSKAAKAAPVPREAPDEGLAEKRAKTVEFFLKQKSAEFEERTAELDEARKRLQEREKKVHQTLEDEIADFLMLLSAETDEVKIVLARYHKLLRTIGTTPDGVLALAKRRAKRKG